MNELGNTPADKNYKPSGISRAEEAAWKKYPMYLAKAVMSDGNTIDLDANETTRNVFKLGYEQAEKDLALTPDDIKLITKIHYEIVFKDTTGIKVGDVASEVLTRFKQIKGDKK